MKSKTALVLEGGGMRGVFTTGVLDFFLDKDLVFDNVTGVSAGAGHACSYLSGQRGRAYKINAGYVSDERYLSIKSLIKTGDIFGADFIYREIPENLNLYDYEAFNSQSTVFRAVVTDLQSGRAEYPVISDMKRDIDYVRASASLPFVSRNVDIEGGIFLDGGVSDPIPFEHMLELGCEKVVVVLTRPHGYKKKKSVGMSLGGTFMYREYPAFRDALKYRHEVYNESLELLEAAEEAGEAFVIRPEHDLLIGRTEKDERKLRRGYKFGYAEAKKRFEELKAYLDE